MRTMTHSILLSLFFVMGCASTTQTGEVGAGRRQFLLVPSEQIVAMSIEGYDKIKFEAQEKKALDQNLDQVKRVQKVAQDLIPHTRVFRDDALEWPWEVHVITSEELNAYCMPGGKMMFYSGIIEKLKLTDSEIAAIMGHEMAHALREHGRERMSEEIVKQIGIEALVATGKLDPKYANAVNVVSTLAISLPHGRGQETEADEIGLELMARAGYNPEAAVSLWQKMNEASGGKAPEFLSTHPSPDKRMKNLSDLIPKVRPLYEKAKPKN